MKKLLSIVLLCALTALPGSAAYAQTPEITAVYAVSNAGSDGNGTPTTTVLYLYGDGTYRQLALSPTSNVTF